MRCPGERSHSEAVGYRVNTEYGDDPATEVDEVVMNVSNTASHEVGHASAAKLEHTDPDDGSVMDKQLPMDEGKRRDFNKADAAKLREKYNK